MSTAMKITKSFYNPIQFRMSDIKRVGQIVLCCQHLGTQIIKYDDKQYQVVYEYDGGELTGFDIRENWVVAGTRYGKLIIWQRNARKPYKVIEFGKEYWIFSIAFLDDDTIAANCIIDNTVIIFSIATNAIIAVVEQHHGNIRQAVNNDLIVFDTANGILLYNWKTNQFREFPQQVDVLNPVFDKSGQWIAATGDDNTVHIFSTKGMELKQTLQTIYDDPDLIQPISKHYLATSIVRSNTIEIWNLATQQQEITETAALDLVKFMDFDENNDVLIICSKQEYTPYFQIEFWKLDFKL